MILFGPRATALTSIYLMGNLVLILGLAVTLLRQSDAATRPVFLLIGAGMLFELAADILQGFTSLAWVASTGTVRTRSSWSTAS